jgi:hypothetical protein
LDRGGPYARLTDERERPDTAAMPVPRTRTTEGNPGGLGVGPAGSRPAVRIGQMFSIESSIVPSLRMRVTFQASADSALSSENVPCALATYG